MATRGRQAVLSLLIVVLGAVSTIGSDDIADLGEEATEALMFDDTANFKMSSPSEHRKDLGESEDTGDQESTAQQAMPLDLSSLEDAVHPRKLEPQIDPKADTKAQKAIDLMIDKLKEAQNRGVEAESKADKAERQADELKRLATVKSDKKKHSILKRESSARAKAKKLRIKAEEEAKKAYEMKMELKEGVKKTMEESEAAVTKAHFAATKAELDRAEALTEAKAAKRKKLVPLDPCDASHESSVVDCKNTTKTNTAKAGTADEVDPSVIKEEEKSCLEEAEKTQTKCKEARVQELSTEEGAQHTLKALGTALTTKRHAMRLAAALASYKDVEKPKMPDGPVGLFQFKGLVYMANKDGTRTWVKFPTYKCHRATAGVVPQQFPESPEKPFVNKLQSKTFCEMGVYKGKGNPDFYENCECSGMSNKKGHGAFCEEWGYKFKWCYVARECAYGNTAFSEELKDTKVLVGCRVHPPAIEP